jgi:hypothetical protein
MEPIQLMTPEEHVQYMWQVLQQFTQELKASTQELKASEQALNEKLAAIEADSKAHTKAFEAKMAEIEARRLEAEARREAERKEAEARREAERKEAEARREAERKEAEARREAERKEAEALREADNKAFQEKFNEMIGHFDRQFGKLVESSMQESLLEMFKSLNIDITHIYPQQKASSGKNSIELDYLLINDTELVIVEVKTTLNKQKVYKMLKKAEVFKTFFKAYRNYKAHIAIAYLQISDDGAQELAEENGIYLLRPNADESYLEWANSEGFVPKTY